MIDDRVGVNWVIVPFALDQLGLGVMWRLGQPPVRADCIHVICCSLRPLPKSS